MGRQCDSAVVRWSRPILRACALVCALFVAAPAYAADKYVRSGGNNGNSGNDWTNAYQTLATCETNTPRGDTCWVGNGSLGSATLNTSNSGTTLITIKKATIADHGVATGWSDAYAAQAVFGDITFDSDYWVFDGVTRDESCATTDDCGWADIDSYGFRVNGAVVTFVDALARCSDEITVSYVGINSGDADASIKASCFTGAESTNHTYRRNLMTNYTNEFAHAHMTVVNGCLLEENYFGSGMGKETIRGQSEFRNCVIRRNIMRGACRAHPGEGCTCHIAIWDGGSGAFDNNEIYGNIIDDRGNPAGDGPSSSCSILVGGNGGSWAGSPASGTLIYNNTIVGVVNTPPNILVNGGTGNVCRNNIFADNTGSPSVTCNTSSNNGSSDEVTTIFVSYAAGDLHLSALLAGVSTGSPAGNATDIDGCTRGADGTWDRGAFEFDADACSMDPPAPPAGGEVAPRNIRIREFTERRPVVVD
jgi:hypothetical protein